MNASTVTAADLQLLVLKDRRPGHFRQSEGVVKALERRLQVSQLDIAQVRRLPLPGRVQRWLARWPSPVAALRLWDIRVDSIPAPDLIVSAGAETLAPNVLLSRYFRARNVFIGSTRGVPRSFFTAVLRAVPCEGDGDQHIRVLKPSSVDPDELDGPRLFQSKRDLHELSVALLVGGDTPRYRFLPADWAGLAELITESAARGLHWRITSSRRTSGATADWLAQLAAQLAESVRFVDYRSSRAGSLTPLLSADAILVTEDSNSMIAEAVASRRPVVVLRSIAAPPQDAALEVLRSEASVAVALMESTTTDALIAAIGSVTPIDHNPLDRLYDQLASAGAIPLD